MNSVVFLLLFLVVSQVPCPSPVVSIVLGAELSHGYPVMLKVDYQIPTIAPPPGSYGVNRKGGNPANAPPLNYTISATPTSFTFTTYEIGSLIVDIDLGYKNVTEQTITWRLYAWHDLHTAAQWPCGGWFGECAKVTVPENQEWQPEVGFGLIVKQSVPVTDPSISLGGEQPLVIYGLRFELTTTRKQDHFPMMEDMFLQPNRPMSWTEFLLEIVVATWKALPIMALGVILWAVFIVLVRRDLRRKS